MGVKPVNLELRGRNWRIILKRERLGLQFGIWGFGEERYLTGCVDSQTGSYLMTSFIFCLNKAVNFIVPSPNSMFYRSGPQETLVSEEGPIKYILRY